MFEDPLLENQQEINLQSSCILKCRWEINSNWLTSILKPIQRKVKNVEKKRLDIK